MEGEQEESLVCGNRMLSLFFLHALEIYVVIRSFHTLAASPCINQHQATPNSIRTGKDQHQLAPVSIDSSIATYTLVRLYRTQYIGKEKTCAMKNLRKDRRSENPLEGERKFTGGGAEINGRKSGNS